MHPWHGAAKTAVTQHFLDREPEVAAKGVTPGTIDATFENLVAEAYSKEGGSHAAKCTSQKMRCARDQGRWEPVQSHAAKCTSPKTAVRA